MAHSSQPKHASPAEISLYCHIGEAVCKTQLVEEALGHSITMKLNGAVPKVEADKFLDKQLSDTLGKAVNLAEKKKLYPLSLQSVLYHFLKQRNWLVHKAMLENKFDLGDIDKQKALFNKIKDISDLAEKVQYAIEWDMIDFCVAEGRDMSKVIERLKKEKGEDRPIF